MNERKEMQGPELSSIRMELRFFFKDLFLIMCMSMCGYVYVCAGV